MIFFALVGRASRVPIHEFDAHAPDAVFAFLDATVSARGRAHWQWKYRLAAMDAPAAFYWQEPDGRVLGFIGLMRTLWHTGAPAARENAHPAAWFVDWHVMPGGGGVGVGLGLLRKAEAVAGTLLTLQGSRDTQQILPRLGWKQSLVPATWVRPLSPRFVADWLARQAPGPLRPVVRWASPLARFALRRRGPAPPAGAELVDIDRFPPDYDAVWGARAPEFAPAMARDAAYLNYLCADFPDGGYRLQLLRVGGVPMGHLISRCDVDGRGLRRGRIVDLLWPRSRPELAAWLVRSATEQLQAAGADYVECVASVGDLRATLHRAGFRSRRPVLIWYHHLPPGADDPERWYITYVDCDRAYR